MNAFKTTIVLLAFLLISTTSFAQMPSTMDGYLYLSQIETALDANMDDEIVWWFSGDTLDGPVRTNDYLAIRERPCFLGPVFSSQDNFIEYSSNPYFAYEPQFNVPEFEFPFEIEELQEVAEDMGNYFPGIDNGVVLKTKIEGTRDGWQLYQWPADSILSESTIINQVVIAYNDNVVIYIDSDLDICGNTIMQNTTIVCDGYVRIMDNLKYADVPMTRPVVPDSSYNTLGLIASGDIHVANTEANGAGNGMSEGPPNDHSNKHCIITASLVSLEGSFSFENKNFMPTDARYDGFWWCDTSGEHSGERDFRGTIYLHGSIVQHRRDFVRMSHCGGTGYEKHYKYDQRLEHLSPPLFDNLVGVDESGQSTGLPLTHRVEKTYPNPFNSSFNLNMTLAKRDQVRIRLVNILGQEVFSQNYGWMDKGLQRFNISIPEKPAGLYFTEITTSSGFTHTSKVVYMK